MIKKFEQVNIGKIKYDIESDESISEFLEKHKLIDLRKWVLFFFIYNNDTFFSIVLLYIGNIYDIIIVFHRNFRKSKL